MVTKGRNETNINAFYNLNPLYRHGYVLRILCSVWTIVKYPPSILRVPVRRASGLSGEYNGTSWHFESTVCSAFVPDVRECHPLLRLPFGIGRFLSRENTELESSKSSPFDRMRLWHEKEREREKGEEEGFHSGRYRNARIYFRTFHRVIAGHFPSSIERVAS